MGLKLSYVALFADQKRKKLYSSENLTKTNINTSSQSINDSSIPLTNQETVGNSINKRTGSCFQTKQIIVDKYIHLLKGPRNGHKQNANFPWSCTYSIKEHENFLRAISYQNFFSFSFLFPVQRNGITYYMRERERERGKLYSWSWNYYPLMLQSWR